MLSDAKVRAAKPRPKSYKLTDTNRLFLLVTPSGGITATTASRKRWPSAPGPRWDWRMPERSGMRPADI